MKRMCDAALVASVLAVGQALAGTPIANSRGMDTPVMNLGSIPVIEVTPTPGAGSAAADAPGAAAGADSPAGGLFEALIADYRWGELKMGAVPHLPVPPPHRMRAEEGADSGEDAPLDGNSGNNLPLHFLHLPLPAFVEGNRLPALPPGGPMPALPAGSPGIAQAPAPAPDQSTSSQGAPQTLPDEIAPATTAPLSTVDTAASTVSDADSAKLEQVMRQLAAASADGARVAGRNDVADAQRMVASARAESAATPVTSTSAPSSALASSFGRALAAANAAAPSEAPRAGSAPGRAAAMVSGTREAQALATQSATISIADVSVAADGADSRRGELSDSLSGSVLRDLTLSQPDTTDFTRPFTLASATLQPGYAPAAAGSARADAPVLQLPTPLQHPEWADGVGERVVWLTQNDVNNAQIRLNPAHLGPVEVRVSIDKDQASVSFVAHNAVTREALESASPRLREMLQAQGFANVNVDISQHSSGHRAAQEQRQPGWAAAQSEDAKDSRAYVPGRSAPRARTGLDTFA